MKYPAVAGPVCALLAACAVGPDYHRPASGVPEAYRDVAPTPETTTQGAASVGDRGWWEVYEDTDLQELIKEALRHNPDVLTAVARIDEAHADLGSTRLNYFPQLSADASVARTKTSLYATPAGAPRINNAAQVRIDASYQLDLWGQLRRMNEAARANFLGSEYAKRSVDVTIVSAVASAYYELVSLDSQLEITRRTIITREKFVELTRAQHERGYATGLDVATAEAQLATARANLPDLERQITQTEDLISVLLGRNPGPVVRAHFGEAVPEAPPRPPAGLPAQLLERRPDIAQAEQGLVAANAEVGVAKAALFPNITLTGSAGSLSVPLGHLLTSPAAEWSLAAGLLQPLLSVQSNLYQVQAADARKRQALSQYQKAVLGALQDVADALVAYQKYGEVERQLEEEVRALRRAREIADARYRIGYASYFDVINADRDLFVSELALAQTYTNSWDSLVRLYASLGGGWQETGTPQDPQGQAPGN